MSIHKSLVLKSRLKRHRNVLSRSERIDLLSTQGKWKEGGSVFGLPKVKTTLPHKAKIKKKEAPEKVATTEQEKETTVEDSKPKTKDSRPKTKG